MKFLFILALFIVSCAPNKDVSKVPVVADITYLNNSHEDFQWGDKELYVYDARIGRFMGKGESISHDVTADVTVHEVAGVITIKNDSLMDIKQGYKVYTTYQGTTSLHFVRNILN